MTEERIKKTEYIYTMEYYIAIRKEQNWVIWNDGDKPRACHTEWSESEIEKQISYINAYRWNLENGRKMILMNPFAKQE